MVLKSQEIKAKLKLNSTIIVALEIEKKEIYD